MNRRTLVLGLALLALHSGVDAQTANERPYVVLVSLDGFRYDYAARFHATNLLAIEKAGASADGMIPSFPTVTFPNHLSIVTGLYPGHHGIVGNEFFDRARNEEYAMRWTADVGSWYSAKPLWLTAEEQGVKSASMFWPTSDAEIAGVRPTYWMKYDTKYPNATRVTTVLDWLRLPEAERPHFITLYFSDVDTSGHNFGPDSPENREAVLRLDALVGNLRQGIQALSLPVNLIVVSDHGMQEPREIVNLGEYVDLSWARFYTGGPFAYIYGQDVQESERIYHALKGKSPKFEVYRRDEAPARWHLFGNPRFGDLIVIANDPVVFVASPPKNKLSKGVHGYDPVQFKSMQAIFYAVGPNIRPGVRLKPFDNVNIFAFMAKILGLQLPAGLDGSGKPLEPVYKVH